MTTRDCITKKTEEKYKILIKLLNKLLINMGKNEITDACEFKNIKRSDLITEKNEKIYEEMKEEIGNYYNNLKYRQKGIIKHYLLTIIKIMCNEIYLEFESKPIRKRKGKGFDAYVIYNINLSNE